MKPHADSRTASIVPPHRIEHLQPLEDAMIWTWAALMPHPPIIIPEVGQGRELEAAATLDGTARLCERLSALHKAGGAPDVLLVLSPHQLYAPGALFINDAPRIRGSLAPFGAPEVVVEADTDAGAMQEFMSALSAAGIPMARGKFEDITRDHGSLVPLRYLAPTFAGEKLPPVIIAGPSGLDLEQALLLGRTLAGLSGERRWALLASGDLSHRLKPGAPAGYSADGAPFDQAVVRALQSGDPSILTDLSPKLRENAGECGLRSVLVMLGLCAGPVEVLSYEGPFGVGYCNALWSPLSSGGTGKMDAAKDAGSKKIRVTVGGAVKANSQETGRTRGHPYARLARLTVERHLAGRPAPEPAEVRAIDPDPKLWNGPKACFVSIKGKDGSLRGCIGSILPTQASLEREIMANAVSAAVRDPRFEPMRSRELDNVDISVDVLSIPEEVKAGMELDPKIWGVIVTQGSRRGLLLPDLPGVTSVEQQIAIAAQKAGIYNLEGAQIQRFTVNRYYEE